MPSLFDPITSYAKQKYNEIPLQDRTLAESMFGYNAPINAKNLSQDQINQLYRTILETRNYRASSVPDKYRGTFDQGGGIVTYPMYNAIGQGFQDYNMLPEAAIHNTLGQFSYKTLPNGNIQVTDNYDFFNDKVAGLTDAQSKTSRYEKMNPVEKAWTVTKETFQPDGLNTFASRFGNAYVGKNTRPVNIEFKPPTPLLSKEQILKGQEFGNIPATFQEEQQFYNPVMMDKQYFNQVLETAKKKKVK